MGQAQTFLRWEVKIIAELEAGIYVFLKDYAD